MSVEKARLEMTPDCKLILKIEAIRSHEKYGSIKAKLL